MRLTDKERNRLTIFTLAELARRRMARGRQLNAPEAIAVISDEVLESAWDGASLADVIHRGKSILTASEVMPGVADLVTYLEVDALFPSGTALVAIEDPIARVEEGPTPARRPGEVRFAEGDIELNAGLPRLEVTATNTSAQWIYVSSHYHFPEANPALHFDRDLTRGMRLDILPGSAVSFGPHETKAVTLIPFSNAPTP